MSGRQDGWLRVEADEPKATIERLGSSNAEFQRRLSPRYERLKPGPGKSAEQVHASQRDRIHRAMVELTAEKGFNRVTVRALTGMAGVSSRTFYMHFADREQCLASTVDAIGRRILSRATLRKPDDATWKGRVSASLQSLLDDFATQPWATRVLLVEVLGAGLPGRRQATELTADLERLLAHLLVAAPMASVPPRRLVIGIAAGLVRIATTTSLTGRTGELPRLIGPLRDWVFDVYGNEALHLCAIPERRSADARRREPCLLPSAASALGGHGESERTLSAALRLAARDGPGALTVSNIRREAGVSRHDFDVRFGDANECLLAAIDSLARTGAQRAYAWSAATGGSQRRLDRTIFALCVLAARNQTQAKLVLAQILVPGRAGLLRREMLVSDAASGLARVSPAALSPIDLAVEASVAAGWRILQEEITAGQAHRLPRVAPLLAYLISRPANRDRKHRIQKVDCSAFSVGTSSARTPSATKQRNQGEKPNDFT